MIMLGVAACYAFRTNKDFSPSLLYLGAFLLDMTIFEATFKLVLS